MAQIFNKKRSFSLTANRSGDATLSQDLRYGDGVPTNLAGLPVPYDSVLETVSIIDAAKFGQYDIQVLDSSDNGDTWAVIYSVAIGTPAIAVTMSSANNSVNYASPHGLSVGDSVYFQTIDGGVPGGGVFLQTTYFVQSVIDTDSITISETNGGSAVAITSNSTGNINGEFYHGGNYTEFLTNPVDLSQNDLVRIRFIYQGSPIKTPSVTLGFEEN